MKKVILMAAASLAVFASSFAQNATVPAKSTMTKVKPAAMPAASAQGTPAAPATQGQAGNMEKGEGRGHDKGHKMGQGEGRGQNGMNAMGLSADQETKFKAANEAHKAAVKAVQMNESLAKEAKKAQVADLKSKYESDVQSILNADQFAKWTAMRAKRDDKKEEGNHKTDPKYEGTEGYEGPANTSNTPVDPNKKRQKPTPKVKPAGN
jgi:hypothetical protein